MSKYAGSAQRKKDERAKKRTDGIGAMISSIHGQVQKFINEWADKHNTLAKLVDSIFKLATTELGRVWGNQQQIVNSIDHIDVNTLAIAELNKDIYARLYRLEQLAELQIPDPEISAALEAGSTALYKEQVKKAFEVVMERRKQEDEARTAAAEKAAADAKAAEEAKKEAETAEAALLDAERASLTNQTAGGQGTDVPEGAEVFGG